MSALSSLKLVAATKPNNIPVIAQRRQKLSAKLWEQIELAKGQASGKPFVTIKTRHIKDQETGLTRSVDIPKRLRPWWWMSDNGKAYVSVRYGSRILELAKGKGSVEVVSPEELVNVLETIRTAVDAGELDTQIEAASKTLRAGFKK